MSLHFKVFSSGAGRVIVVIHPECTIDRDSILALLIEAGFDPASVSFLSPDEAASEVAIGEECTIIPVDGNVTGAPELDEAARQANMVRSAVGLRLLFESRSPAAPTRCGQQMRLAHRSSAQGRTQ
jgi:hypothetical protein